jgi:cytochrome c oxidase cbb3-type subunit 3
MNPASDPQEEALKPHTYDGIREYDKRLPNWWLWTFYGAMIFSFGYWLHYHRSIPLPSAEQRLQSRLTELALKASAGGRVELTDAQLWEMSRDPSAVAAGRETFTTTCVSCHGAKLEGGIGAKLSDTEWVHGGLPTQVAATVSKGVLEKGMPAWGPVLGARKVNELVAYVMSHHKEGEPITIVPSAAPGPAAVPAASPAP